VSSNEQPTADCKDQVLSRWKEYFEQHLNKSFKEQPHTNQEPASENDIFINFPRCDEIVEAIYALEYLKDNKAAGLDLIATELLTNGEPNLTRWFSRFESARHYLKAGPRGYCVECTRRAIRLIARIIAASAYWMPTEVLLYEVGFNSGKSTTDQLEKTTNSTSQLIIY
jgi:hypothetical protein